MRDSADPVGGGFWPDTDGTQALERFRTLVNMVDDGIYQLDTAGRFVAVNDTIVEMTGYAREELLGEHASLVIEEEDADRLQGEIARRLSGDDGGAEPVEFTALSADGEPIPCELEFHVLVEEGTFEGSVGVVRDITDRKQAERKLRDREQELRRKERRYEAVFEDPNILVGLLDPDGTVLDVNRTAMEYIEAERETVIGDPFWETPWWGEGEDIRADVKAWTDRAAAGEYVDFEADLTRPDGQRYTISGYFRPVTDENGDVVSIIVSDRDVTERKRRERELAASEQRYRTLVENFPNGAVALVDDDLRYRIAGGTPVDVEAETADDLEGTPIREAITEELADVLEPRYQAALEGESSTFEHEHSGRHSRFHIFPVRDDDGEVVAAMGMSQDITERREAQRRLEESEQRYRTLVENFPNGAVGLFDEELRYQIAGGEALDEVGASVGDIVGKTPWERYPEDLAERLEPRFRAALDGESNSFEFEFHGRHWAAYTVPVRDDDGEPFAGTIMVQDITERKEREQALQESKNQLQALIDVLPVAVFVAEADGEIVEWNEAAEEIWGGEVFESESIAEYEEYEAWWADSGDPVQPDEWPLARALQGEEVTDPDEIRIKGFDGEYRTVLNHGMPVRDAEGEVSRAVVTLVDISERKEYQRKLEESNERLEQFAYAASHDLQEPLRMVSSYLQLIEDRYGDALDEDGREFLEFAVDGAERMRDMIEGLLKYSRVDTRGDPFEPVDLNAVLADVRQDLRVKIEESDAEVTASELPEVYGDGGQLNQVFQNLLTNAIEYSGEDPPRIHVDAERTGDEWTISVSDEGIGIDPDDADRIFQVFQSLHRDGRDGSTGIGLALCERIVERHGGDIWVDSEPGEGATFSFTLPATKDG